MFSKMTGFTANVMSTEHQPANSVNHLGLSFQNHGGLLNKKMCSTITLRDSDIANEDIVNDSSPVDIECSFLKIKEKPLPKSESFVDYRVNGKERKIAMIRIHGSGWQSIITEHDYPRLGVCEDDYLDSSHPPGKQSTSRVNNTKGRRDKRDKNFKKDSPLDIISECSSSSSSSEDSLVILNETVRNEPYTVIITDSSSADEESDPVLALTLNTTNVGLTSSSISRKTSKTSQDKVIKGTTQVPIEIPNVIISSKVIVDHDHRNPVCVHDEAEATTPASVNYQPNHEPPVGLSMGCEEVVEKGKDFYLTSLASFRSSDAIGPSARSSPGMLSKSQNAKRRRLNSDGAQQPSVTDTESTKKSSSSKHGSPAGENLVLPIDSVPLAVLRSWVRPLDGTILEELLNLPALEELANKTLHLIAENFKT